MGLFFEFIFDSGPFSGDWYGNKQPFVYAMGDDTGYGLHGDFLNGWDPVILQNGIDKFTTDNAGDAGNVYFDNIFSAPAQYGDGCSLPPLVDEQVNGLLDALPGCNPVSDNPVPPTNCQATKTLGVVTSGIYTDMTAQGWEYLGCGVDQYGNNALPTKVADTNTMTVEICTKMCGDAGFTISGLEYASQCFCGNTLPASASPTPGVVGTCNKPCTGNANEKCGDGNRLSLYKKCASGACTNADFTPIAYAGGSPQPVPAPIPGPPSSSATAPAASNVLVSNPGPPSSSAVAPAASNVLASNPPPSLSSPIYVNPSGSSGAAQSTPQPDTQGPSGVTYPKAPQQDTTSSYTSFTTSYSSTASTTATAVPVSPGPGGDSPPSVHLPTGWSAVGCYTDSTDTRTLQGINLAWWGQPMTSSGCAAYCDAQGFSIAGTENGGQCYCDNKLNGGSTKAAATDCNLPCNGSDKETCGGPGRLSMFSKKPLTNRRRHLNAHLMDASKI